MTREKVTIEDRIEAAKTCAEGRTSQSEAARRLGINESTVREWVTRYKAGGVLAFKGQEHNTAYTEELKAAQEPRTELEEAKVKIAQLEHELNMARMERDLLKNWTSWRGEMPFASKTEESVRIHP